MYFVRVGSGCRSGYSMVLILHGNSEVGAHLRFSASEKDLVYFTRAQSVLSYQLIWDVTAPSKGFFPLFSKVTLCQKNYKNSDTNYFQQSSETKLYCII